MDARLVQRVKAEVGLLGREVGSVQVSKGTVSVGGTTYLGVMLRGLRVDAARFGGSKSVGMLILLPPHYPCTPPLGVYLDRPYEMARSKHFVRKGGHGAPSLVKRGWYWYCHALGGFEGEKARKRWRPAGDPAGGHNLATVVAAARVSLHS